ncbi:hypothetical protein [Actinoallomurus sp. CA-142502]|uniref:hypothetical protein n=1 Tax=Actinoallomurus sp. CA-142502 TaxID=3239885 RepID=UPI003D8D6446
MKLVTIKHPEAGEAQVPESAVSHWRSSGWEVAEDKPAAPKPKTDEDPADNEAGASKPSGKTRRRTNEGE